MKRLTTLLLFFFAFALTNAQFEQIAEGPEFKEVDEGFEDIIQLKNGNTIFFHISIKNGIVTKLYDAKHKQKAEQQIEPQYGKLEAGSVRAVFESGNDVTLLISELDDQIPVLYRLIIDGATGKLKEEKKIAEMEKLTRSQAKDAERGWASPEFYIRKDPGSEYYALVMYNNFAKDLSKSIEVIHYSPDHKEISRAFYSPVNGKYDKLYYEDMIVFGKEKVVVLLSFYTKDEPDEIKLATLNAGSAAMTVNEIGFLRDRWAFNGMIKYNPITNKIILLAVVRPDKKKPEYETYLANIDPATMKPEKAEVIYPKEANEKVFEIFGGKASYQGVPQNLFITEEGYLSVLFEEVTVDSWYSNATHEYRTDTDLKNLAAAFFNPDGKETKNYFMPKNHFIAKEGLGIMYHRRLEEQSQKLHWGNQFMSFVCLQSSGKTYILLNDLKEYDRQTVLERKKVGRIMSATRCDGFYYELSGEDVYPERKPIFGKLADDIESCPVLFSVSDYNKEKNVLATIKMEVRKKSKSMKIVWLQPQ